MVCLVDEEIPWIFWSHLHELPQLGEGSREQLQQLRLHVWGVGPHRRQKVEGGKL